LTTQTTLQNGQRKSACETARSVQNGPTIVRVPYRPTPQTVGSSATAQSFGPDLTERRAPTAGVHFTDSNGVKSSLPGSSQGVGSSRHISVPSVRPGRTSIPR